MSRYAQAVGKRIVIKLVDADAPLAAAKHVRGAIAAKDSAAGSARSG